MHLPTDRLTETATRMQCRIYKCRHITSALNCDGGARRSIYSHRIGAVNPFAGLAGLEQANWIWNLRGLGIHPLWHRMASRSADKSFVVHCKCVLRRLNRSLEAKSI